MNACCFGSFPRQQADSLPEVRRPSKTNFENIFANFSEIGGCALRTLPVLYFLADADVAQLVEHDLAKVGVAGSNPVVRSIVANRPVIIKSFDRPFHDGVDEVATWPSGKAEACKAFTPGSNPGVASIRSSLRGRMTKHCTLHNADVAQLVEHDLAKVGVAGSNPVVRSTKPRPPDIDPAGFFMPLAYSGQIPAYRTRSPCSRDTSAAGSPPMAGALQRLVNLPVPAG